MRRYRRIGAIGNGQGGERCGVVRDGSVWRDRKVDG